MEIINMEENEKNESEPRIISLAKRANAQYEEGVITNGKMLLAEIYNSVIDNPGQLNNVKDFTILGTVFLLMVNTKIVDDAYILQIMSSIGYLCLSKALEEDPNDIYLVRLRLLILRVGHDYLQNTVMSMLGINNESIISVSASRTAFRARDAMYKMEIADLELHPEIYRQRSLFSERKKEFSIMIEKQFFMPDITMESIINSGMETHKKLIDFLEDKIMIKMETDL